MQDMIILLNFLIKFKLEEWKLKIIITLKNHIHLQVLIVCQIIMNGYKMKIANLAIKTNNIKLNNLVILVQIQIMMKYKIRTKLLVQKRVIKCI